MSAANGIRVAAGDASHSSVSLEAIRTWTAQDVAQWLERNRMGKYARIFMDHEVVGDILLELTLSSLKALNIPTVGDRVRLNVLIQGLRRKVCGSSTLPTLLMPIQSPLSATTVAKSELTPLKESSDNLPSANSGNGSGSGMKTSGSIMSMAYVKQHCIKVIGEKNETRVVNVKDINDPKLVMDKILAKFNIVDGPEKFSLFVSMSDSARICSESELIEICKDPSRPEREKLFLRKKHTPFMFSRAAKEGSEQPTIRQRMAMVDDHASNSKLPGGKSVMKLNKFFGERPPSELISSNLLDFFPKDGVLKMERRKSRGVRKAQSMLVDDPQLDTNEETKGPSDDFSKFELRTYPSRRGSLNRNRPAPISVRKSSRQSSIDNLESPSSGTRTQAEPSEPSTTVSSMDRDEVAKPAHKSVDALKAGVNTDLMSPSSLGSEPVSPVTPTNPESAPSRWIKGALIGQGSFGAVYLGLNYFTGELMAVKQVELPPESVEGSSGSKDRRAVMVQALQHEISFLKDLHHPHIVRYLGSTADEKYFNIFLEYIPGGSIYANLKTWGVLPEPVIKSYLRQIIEGLEYLHDRDIIHRDIKAANILVDNHAHVKISDFGISKRVDREEILPMSSSGDEESEADGKEGKGNGTAASMRVSLQGSVYWMAPEIVKHMKYTRKSDIWSVGCLVIEMFTANHPWGNASQVEVLFKLGSEKRPELPTENLSEDAIDLLNQTFDLYV